jgi:type II secretory pathway component HofQ
MIAQNALLDVAADGSFQSPGGVRPEAMESVRREISKRRHQSDVSTEEVQKAGRVLGSADRSAFGLAARTAQKDTPQESRQHFELASARQIAAAAHLAPDAREAALTVASARPEVVQEAFAPDYRSFGWSDMQPASHAHDPDLFDRQGGLERFREKSEGRRGSSRGSEGDEGLPF